MEITNRLEAAQYVRIVLGAKDIDVTLEESLDVANLLRDVFGHWGDNANLKDHTIVAALAKVRAGHDAN